MTYDFKPLAQIFAQVTPQDIARLAAQIKSHPRIFLYGAGRSGLMLKAFAMRLAQAGRCAFVVGETTTPAITARDLLILASASGKTPSVCRCAETARGIGATVFAITSPTVSPLGEQASERIDLPAPSKDSVAPGCIMGTHFEQALLLLCDLAVEELGEDIAAMRTRHANLE